MPFNYTAPDHRSYGESALSVLSALSHFWSSSVSSISSSESIGGLILPAQEREDVRISGRDISSIGNIYDVSVHKGKVKTYDGAELDTIQVASNKPDSHRYIIKFNGNGGLYQDLIYDYARDAQKLNATVIGFNYRGVGKSRPAPKRYEDLVTDGIAQVNRLLLDKKVKSEHIILDGHSLGGSVAVMVAAYFHKKGKPVYVINDRSFSSLSAAAGGILAEAISLPESSLAVSTSSLLVPTGWEVDVARAYREIPDKYKTYMVVDKEGANGLGDGVISNQASLDKALKKERGNRGHHFSFFKAGHNAGRDDLKSTSTPGLSAQQVYEDFVMRVG